MNAGKTTIIICATGLDLKQRSGNFPCAICRTGVGSNTHAFTHAEGSSAFKMTQTTDALYVKEPIDEDHRRRFWLYNMTNLRQATWGTCSLQLVDVIFQLLM